MPIHEHIGLMVLEPTVELDQFEFFRKKGY